MTQPTTPDAGKRLIQLAQTSRPTPEVGLSDNAYTQLRRGFGVYDGSETALDLTEGFPLYSTPRRINAYDDAERLQIRYRAIQKRYSVMTAPAQRLALIRSHCHRDAAGALCAYVSGVVTDHATAPGNRLSRICLSAPQVVDNPFHRTGEPLDSHIWLLADLMDPKADYADPQDPDPLIHHQPGCKLSGRISLGDTIGIAGRITTYTDRSGYKRLGIGEWTALTGALIYVQLYADGTRRMQSVPSHLERNMTILTIDEQGAPTWADPSELTAQIVRTEWKWPEALEGPMLRRPDAGGSL